MKSHLLIAILLLFSKFSLAQSDSLAYYYVEVPDSEHAEILYNPQIKTYSLSYNYSNKWDFDLDGQNDSLLFIGNNGVHRYYYLRIVLSSDHIVRDYPTIQLDMPYPNEKADLGANASTSVSLFSVSDFDKDGILDIYLNFGNHFSTIPNKWKKMGVTKTQVLMTFKAGDFKVRNYN